jgi:hypothetical protein
MLICADTPIINNPAHHYRPTPGDQFDLPSLPLALETAGMSWANYGGYALHYIQELAGRHSRDLFAHQAAQGALPTVSWVYGDGRPDLGEHPKQDITHGMQWTMDQIKAVVGGRPLGLGRHLRDLGRLGRLVRSREPARRGAMGQRASSARG